MSEHHTVTMLDGGEGTSGVLLHEAPSAEGLTRRRSHGAEEPGPGPVTESALDGKDSTGLASFLNPRDGGDELERRFPMYCKQLRWIGVRSSKCEMRTLKLAAAVVGQVLQMWSSYVVFHRCLGFSHIFAVSQIIGVSNATGKVFAAGLQVDPGGERPCPSDAAFSNFSEADWKLLTMVRLNGPGQLGPTIGLGPIIGLIIPAIVAPSVFKGQWFEFMVCLITFYAACVPWWSGITGHFILCCPAMMLQLKNMRDELLVLVAGVEGKDTAATWRKSLSIKSSKDLSKVAPAPDAESESTSTIAMSPKEIETRADEFIVKHAVMCDQMNRFSTSWSGFVLIVEFLIILALIPLWYSIGSGNIIRSDFYEMEGTTKDLKGVLIFYAWFQGIMIATIWPTIAGLMGFVTSFADKLPNAVSRLAAHRSAKLAELREVLLAADVGFKLMGVRITPVFLLTMFYSSFTGVAGVWLYLNNN